VDDYEINTSLQGVTMTDLSTPPRERERPRNPWPATFLTAVVILFLGTVVGAAVVTRDSGSAPTLAGGAKTVKVTLGEFFVKPATITVDPGTDLTLVVTNSGTMSHDLKLKGGSTGTKLLDPGSSQTVDYGVVSTSTQAWCTVPGHKQAGMLLDIKVGAGGGTQASATAAMAGMDMGSPTASSNASSNDATIDPNAVPNANWKPFDPTLRPAPGGTVHDITMNATEKVLEVAPGVKQQMWTFNDQVPGPILRGKLGDVFNVTLTNKGKMGHSIDFHASQVAWSDEMRTIAPGESLTYQFKADYAGIFMYHCGTAPALHHIGNGMYGALIVDPPDLAPVDHEFVAIQSELYLGPQGQPGDLAKMTAFQPDAVVFNGYYDQYKFAPIRVEPNQRIRFWVLDAGPSENESFHIVGTVFHTVYKEGNYLLRPGPGRGGSQSLDLQPAQGGFVEFSPAEKGFYVIVTHKFSNVGKGAMGMLQAGDVKMPAAAGH
jgi:nitrite reductase (NO-forming)